MSAVVEDLLRLAWEANDAGRPGMRDALLTLVVAESGPGDAVVAERCRRLLVAHRPDHCFAASATLGQALTRPKVVQALAALRLMYPPVRVRHLLLRAEAARGPYTPHRPPTARLLEDLLLDRGIAPAAAHARDRRRARALPFPAYAQAQGPRPGFDPDGKVAVFYVSVLFALAILLDSTLRPTPGGETGAGSKAA